MYIYIFFIFFITFFRNSESAKIIQFGGQTETVSETNFSTLVVSPIPISVSVSISASGHYSWKLSLHDGSTRIWIIGLTDK